MCGSGGLGGERRITPGSVNSSVYRDYARSGDRERIEVWSGLDRFRHVHFMTRDVDETVAWYAQLLNVEPLVASAADTFGLGNGLPLEDGVQLFYASAPGDPRVRAHRRSSARAHRIFR
jgi:hypothetical protein